MIVKEDKCLFLLGFLLLALSEHAQYIRGVIFSSVQHLQYSTFNTDRLFIHFSKKIGFMFCSFKNVKYTLLKVRFRIAQTV